MEKPISYIVVKYDLFPYCLVHPVYKWSDTGDAICGGGLSFYRESILVVLNVERGKIASKAVEDARENYDKIKDETRLTLGKKFKDGIWELKDKISYVKDTITFPKGN